MSVTNKSGDAEGLVSQFIDREISRADSSEVTTSLLAGVHLIVENPNIVKYPLFFKVARFVTKFFGEIFGRNFSKAKATIADYNINKLDDYSRRNREIPPQLFKKFFVFTQQERAGEAILTESSHPQFKDKLAYFMELRGKIGPSINKLGGLIPDNNLNLRQALQNLDSITADTFDDYCSGLETLVHLAEQLDKCDNDKRKITTLKNVLEAWPDRKDYQTAFDQLVSDPVFSELTHEELGQISFDKIESQVDILRGSAQSILWGKGLVDIERLDPAFAEKVSICLSQAKITTDFSESPEGQLILELVQLMNDLSAERWPAEMRLTKQAFVKQLAEGSGASDDSEKFFAYLREAIGSARAEQYDKMPFIALEIGGQKFKEDFETYFLPQDRKLNPQYKSGGESVANHPFLAADTGKQMQDVLRAKALGDGVLTEQQFDLLFEYLPQLFEKAQMDQQVFYEKASSWLEIAEELHRAHSFSDVIKKSLASPGDYQNLMKEYSQIADTVLATWVGILVTRPDVEPEGWKKPLSVLLEVAGGIDAGSIKYGPEVISAVLSDFAAMNGFPNDLALFNQALNDPNLKRHLMLACKTESLHESHKAEFEGQWKKSFLQGPLQGLDHEVLSPFIKVAEYYFAGAVDPEVIKILQETTLIGVSLINDLQASPEVIAEGCENYFKQSSILQAPVSQVVLLPYCQKLPPLDQWEDTFARLISELGVELTDAENLTGLIKADEGRLAPKSEREVRVMVKMYAEALATLKDRKFVEGADSKHAVTGGCLKWLIAQREGFSLLAVPSAQEMISLYFSELPEVEKWQERLIANDAADLTRLMLQKADLGKFDETAIKSVKERLTIADQLIQEVNRLNLKGPVSEKEFIFLQGYVIKAQELVKQGYSLDVAVAAICRSIQEQRLNRNELHVLDQDAQIRPFCFEAVIEKALGHLPREQVEAVITLFNQVEGRDSYLADAGKRRLQKMALLIASSKFFRGRPLEHFRLAAKLPQILQAIGLYSVEELNNSLISDELLSEMFTDQLDYAFGNLNLRELLEAVSEDPAKALFSVVNPLISTLTGNKGVHNDPQTERELSSIVTAFSMSGRAQALFDRLQKFVDQIKESGGLEFDLELSTQDVISKALSELRDPQNGPVVKKALDSIAEEVAAAQVARMERSNSNESLPFIGVLEALQGLKLPDWFVNLASSMGPGSAQRLMNIPLARGLLTRFAQQFLNKTLTKQTKRLEVEMELISRTIALQGNGDFQGAVNQQISLLQGKKLKPAEQQQLEILNKLRWLTGPQARRRLSEIQTQKQLLDNLKPVIPQLVEVGAKIGMHFLQNCNLKAHQDLINVILKISKNAGEPVDKAHLSDLLFKSMEQVLEDSKTIFSGLFEGVLQGVKSIPVKEEFKMAEVDEATLSGLERAGDHQNRAAGEANKQMFADFMQARFEEGFFASELKQTARNQLLPHFLTEFEILFEESSFDSQELEEVASLMEISVSMMNANEQMFYSPAEMAIACKNYCLDLKRSGKRITAPEGWTDSTKQSALLPYAFDGVVINATRGAIGAGNARMLPQSEETEKALEEKVALLFNAQRFLGTQKALNSNGRQAIETIIKTMMNQQFASGMKLSHPNLLHRFPLILAAMDLHDVDALNSAHVGSLESLLIQKSKGYLGSITLGTVLEKLDKDPLENSLKTLGNAALTPLMRGNPAVLEESKVVLGQLAEAFGSAELFQRYRQKIASQVGVLGAIGPLKLKLDVSTSQVAEGLKGNLDKLLVDSKNGKIPSEAEAKEYGFLAPLLIKAVKNVAEAQEFRNDANLKTGQKVPGMVDVLDDLGASFESVMFGAVKGKMKPSRGLGLIFSLLDFANGIGLLKPFLNNTGFIQWISSKLQKKFDRKLAELGQIQNRELTDQEKDQLVLYRLLAANSQKMVQIGMNLLSVVLEGHDLSKHDALIRYIMELANDPDKKVDQKKLLGLFLESTRGLLDELGGYEELMPSLIAAMGTPD